MQRDTERNKEWKRRSLSRRQELDILRIIGSFMVEGLQHVRALFSEKYLHEARGLGN